MALQVMGFGLGCLNLLGDLSFVKIINDRKKLNTIHFLSLKNLISILYKKNIT